MEPVDALTEIAALLERERASRYRSKAFRTAAAAIAGLSREQLADTAALRRRAGIGDSSLAVIRQALAGEVPDYLARACASGIAPARSALRGRSCAETCTATPTGRTARPHRRDGRRRRGRSVTSTSR